MRKALNTAALAAALIALPAAAFAQVDAAGAKQHLSAARDTLSQLTALPEAAKLTGDARAQVSQLIANFNELITTQANWRAAYGKVDANLTSLLGPDVPAPAADQPVGTAGSTGIQLDPSVRTKLTEFRSHLKAFETSAGGAAAEAGAGAMPPAAATASTSNPANPTAAPGSVNPSSPTTSMAPADREKAAAEVAASAPNADAQKELDAISKILDASRTGALTKAQTAQLKKHVEALRALLSR